MISVTPQGRRAEEFAALVEGRGRIDNARNTDLLDVVSAMRSVRSPEPRPEFVASLREQLMAEAEIVLSDVERKLTLPAPKRNGRDRRIAIAAGAIALVGVTSSVAVASQGALPGDTLYPIKRALEGATTTLTFDETAKAERLLDNASGRLSEVEALAQRGAAGKAQLPGTLATFSQQTEDAADLLLDDYAANGNKQAIQTLREFTASSMTKLGTLGGKLPQDMLGQLTEAVSVLTRVDDLAAQLCPECGGGIEELPLSLARLAAHATDPSAQNIPPAQDLSLEGEVTKPGRNQDPSSPASPTQLPSTPPPATSTDKPSTDKPSSKPSQDKLPEIADVPGILLGDGAPLGEGGLVDDLLSALLGGDGLRRDDTP